MWTRSDLKLRAKASLRNGYWMAFAAALIVGVITSVFSGISSAGLSRYTAELAAAIESGNEILLQGALEGLSSVMTRSGFISLIFGIFLLNPLTVGLMKYFLRAADGENELSNIWGGFKGNYKNVIWTLFKRNLFVGLWSLLFIIPGIIKSYQYAMVEYILADDPDISSHDALIQSREMMNGNKWRYFVLELSFIGWFLLGSIACGIGTLFVMPYYHATMTQFYLTVKPQNNTAEAQAV